MQAHARFHLPDRNPRRLHIPSSMNHDIPSLHERNIRRATAHARLIGLLLRPVSPSMYHIWCYQSSVRLILDRGPPFFSPPAQSGSIIRSVFLATYSTGAIRDSPSALHKVTRYYVACRYLSNRIIIFFTMPTRPIQVPSPGSRILLFSSANNTSRMY